MTDMTFALDGLYAAGWWPHDSDDCRLSEDRRWYPSHETILEAFTHNGIDLYISMPLNGHPVTVRWHSARSGPQTVTAQTQTEAMLLAFSRSFQSASRSTQPSNH